VSVCRSQPSSTAPRAEHVRAERAGSGSIALNSILRRGSRTVPVLCATVQRRRALSTSWPVFLPTFARTWIRGDVGRSRRRAWLHLATWPYRWMLATAQLRVCGVVDIRVLRGYTCGRCRVPFICVPASFVSIQIARVQPGSASAHGVCGRGALDVEGGMCRLSTNG
jgi:hypothetical protein